MEESQVQGSCWGSRKLGFDHGSVPAWRRKWQPTPVFLPGESRGQRSLVGCCPWGRTESDTTEVTVAAAAVPAAETLLGKLWPPHVHWAERQPWASFSRPDVSVPLRLAQ